MNQINQTWDELKAAVLEYVNTDSASITPCAYSVLTGFLDYTFELEKELKRQGEEIKRLRGIGDTIKRT